MASTDRAEVVATAAGSGPRRAPACRSERSRTLPTTVMEATSAIQTTCERRMPLRAMTEVVLEARVIRSFLAYPEMETASGETGHKLVKSMQFPAGPHSDRTHCRVLMILGRYLERFAYWR